jgi:ATP-dependent RNA helicase DeaD
MTDFEKLGVCPELIDGIADLGFEHPMPIQEKVIPFILNQDRDLVGLAQTGTGKTAAFGIPLIQQMDFSKKNVQALILCPTRELCRQITSDLGDYSKYYKMVTSVAVYGGASVDTQIKALKEHPQIVVATPGRLLDLIKRKKVDVSAIRWLILDEADEMLNMGFQEELTAIIDNTPPSKHTYLFSATMPREVSDIARGYLNDPMEITIGRRNEGAENVRHLYYMVQARDRYAALKRIIDFTPSIYGIIFCRTRLETKDVSDKLIEDGYDADALHGDLSQAQRDYVMHKFRVKNLQMIVATDVAARGLDVDDLTHIINYNLPDDLQVYTHRSGRTGRAGKPGTSVAIIHQKETFKIKQIEKIMNKKFEYQSVPDGKAICEKQLFHIINRMERVEVDDSQIDPYLETIHKKLEWLDREQLVKQFVALEFNRFLSYYRQAPDLNAPIHGHGERGKQKRNDRKVKKSRVDHSDLTRLFVNVGKKNGIDPLGLIGMVNDATGTRNIEIGKIDILNTFTFFEVDSNYVGAILKSLPELTVKGNRVKVEIAVPKEGKRESKRKGVKRNKKPFYEFKSSSTTRKKKK